MKMSAEQFLRAASALHVHEMDGLKLFRPTRTQERELRRMARDTTFECLIVAGNRAGKTVLAAAFFAAFVRDEPITTFDGDKIYCRPEWLRGKPVNVWVIGDHLKHLGMTIYRLLFEENPSQGMFRIILDDDTGVWRCWNPEEHPHDKGRKGDTVWAPPILPERLFDGPIAWAPGRKNEHEFRTIRFKSGSTIHGFASSGEVKQGDTCHLIWNDENIHSANKHYYEEWRKRLMEDEGMMLWSTMPRDDCYVFSEVIDRAESMQEEVDGGERTIEEQTTIKVKLSLLDSPFVPQRQKEIALATSGDREALRRIYGERSTQLISVYQDYNPNYHVVHYDDNSLNDKLEEVLRENNWVPPADWTRELTLDPGTQKPAIILGAVPPPGLWDNNEPYYVVYREIFIRRATPWDLAAKVMETECDYVFERFIIDGRMGRQKPPGFTETVDYQYSKAFLANKLVSRQTGSGFIYGDDDFKRRSSMVIRAMRTRDSGRPQLRIINQTCPNLVKQLRSNVRKTTPDGEPMEEQAENQVDDLRHCLEYWISRRPVWHFRSDEAPAFRDPVDEAYAEICRQHERYKEKKPRQHSIPIGVPV